MSTIKAKNLKQTVIGGTTQPLTIGGIASDNSDAKISISSAGVVNLANGTTMNSLPMFACRAWAVFNGSNSGTFYPINSGNISSITKITTGKYTIYFITPMPDANYSVNVSASSGIDTTGIMATILNLTTTSFQVNTQYISSNIGLADRDIVTVSVFR